MLNQGNKLSDIKKCRKTIMENAYESADSLEHAFNEILNNNLNMNWTDLDNKTTKNADLTELNQVHSFLIDEVMRNQREEYDHHNAAAYERSLSIDSLRENAVDGKRAHGMYYFTDEAYTYYFIGDLHSDTISLRRVLETVQFFKSMVAGEKVRLIFLGDYVDRGIAHLKTMEMVLLLKYLFPNNIYLLKGNHDGGKLQDGAMNLVIGRDLVSPDDAYFVLFIYNLATVNPTFEISTVEKYLAFFDALANVAFFGLEDANIMAVHGGIPRPRVDTSTYYGHIHTIADLADERLRDINDMTIFHNMLWSDPREVIEDDWVVRKRFQFTMDHFKAFADALGIDMLIRGHEAEPDGYRTYFDNRVITLFSSGVILNEQMENINTETAYGYITPCILRKRKGEQLKLMQL